MSDYPEHEKMRAITDQSQVIGEFLDFGLPELGLVLYERFIRECECHPCRIRDGARSGWHTEEEKATIIDGRVQFTEYRPAQKAIATILAEHFGIDQTKIDTEKEQMLRDIREAAAQ